MGGDVSRTAALDNLHKLNLALLMYSQDYDEIMPTSNQSKIQSLLMPYTGDSSVFTDPINSKPFQWNTWLSGQSMAQFTDFSKIATFYDQDSSLASNRPIVLLNGTAKSVTDSEWQALKLSSHIP